jgi:hypothetical protein
MAKKKSGSFVMSKEIMNLVSKNPDLKGREVIELVQKKFPKEDINVKSAAVAFSNARKALGIGKSNTKTTSPRKASGSSDVAALKAARDFVSSVGDTKSALAAIQQLEDLQL